MPTIHLETLIAAPIDRCFDLMRDVDAHIRSTAGTQERAIAGKASGLLADGDEAASDQRQVAGRALLLDPIHCGHSATR